MYSPVLGLMAPSKKMQFTNILWPRVGKPFTEIAEKTLLSRMNAATCGGWRDCANARLVRGLRKKVFSALSCFVTASRTAPHV